MLHNKSHQSIKPTNRLGKKTHHHHHINHKRPQTKRVLSHPTAATFSTTSHKADELPKGPVMPELHRMAQILDREQASYYKTRPDELSIISRRSVDKFGLFTRTSPPLLQLVPDHMKKDLKLDNRVLFMDKGDVNVLVLPISLPDEVKRNKAMVDSVMDHIHLDAVVVPLAAMPADLKDLTNPFERPGVDQVKFDVFDPDTSPFPPRIRSGEETLVETAQYTAYKAFDQNLDIALSGRLEVVSFNNYKLKGLLTDDVQRQQDTERFVLRGQATNATLAQAQNICVLPHTPSLDPLVETTFNFEPALLATATIRSTIEEQQALYNQAVEHYNTWHQKKRRHEQYLELAACGGDLSVFGDNVPDLPTGEAPTKPTKRMVMALIDTAQLRHFENAYDIVDLLEDNDFVYLKRGFEQYFTATKTPTLRQRLLAAHEGCFSLKEPFDETAKNNNNNNNNVGSDGSDDEDDGILGLPEENNDTKYGPGPRNAFEVTLTKAGKKLYNKTKADPGLLADPTTSQLDMDKALAQGPGDDIKAALMVQQHRIDTLRVLMTDKHTKNSLTRPFSQIHLLYTSIYGPVADQNKAYCGSCKFEFDDMYFYTSKNTCQSKPLFTFTKKPCTRPYDWSFNPEAVRFPPFDMDFEEVMESTKQFQDKLNIDLFSQWMTMRRALQQYETENGEVSTKTIEEVRDNILELFKIWNNNLVDYKAKTKASTTLGEEKLLDEVLLKAKEKLENQKLEKQHKEQQQQKEQQQKEQQQKQPEQNKVGELNQPAQTIEPTTLASLAAATKQSDAKVQNDETTQEKKKEEPSEEQQEKK